MQRMFRRATSQRESLVVEDYNLTAGGRRGMTQPRIDTGFWTQKGNAKEAISKAWSKFFHIAGVPGAPESQRRTVGPTDYDTPQYSSSSYSDTSHSFDYPIPDISIQPPTRWVYEWKDPHFYTMLVQKWETTSAWTGQSWQDYKAELLRVRGLNVMSTAEYEMTSQMGVFPFLR